MSVLRLMVVCGLVSAVVGSSAALVVTAVAGSQDEAVLVGAPTYGCLDTTGGALYLGSKEGDCKAGLVPVTWQGTEGADGPAGGDGAEGSAGADGADGADGSGGAAGAAGETGATGARGVTGSTGSRGADGADGADGAEGATGSTGPRGAKGDTGENGAQGEKGDAGATGPQGEQGATGATGATGEQGEQGEQGETGAVAWSAVAAWLPTTTYTAGPPASVVTLSGSTYVAARSSVNADPTTSPADWILIAAAGAKGDKGDQGDRGETGETGEKGEKGDAGSAGEEGAVGPAGPTGPQGPQGIQGLTGPAGNSLLADKFGTQGQSFPRGNLYDCTMGSISLAVYTHGIPADGRILPISAYPTLYSLFGTRYGGDGVATFGVPDLRDVTPNGLNYGICSEGIYPPAP